MGTVGGTDWRFVLREGTTEQLVSLLLLELNCEVLSILVIPMSLKQLASRRMYIRTYKYVYVCVFENA